MQKKYWLFTTAVIFLGSIYFLASCSTDQIPNATLTIVTTPEIVNSATAPYDAIQDTHTPSPTITLTPFPTLDDPLSYLIELMLTNAGCNLPCVLGITPDSITMTRAIEYFQSFQLFGEYLDKPGHPYAFFNDYNIGLIHIEITGDENGLVDSVSLWELTPYPSNPSTYFSPLNVIEDLGTPSQVIIDLGYSPTRGLTDDPAVVQVETELFFESAKVYVIYEGLARKMGEAFIFCPSQPDTKGESLGYIRVCSGFGEELDAFHGSLCDPEVKFNAMISDDAINLSASEFTEQIIQTQGEACFTTLRSIWP
jgi:hypothetical protein